MRLDSSHIVRAVFFVAFQALWLARHEQGNPLTYWVIKPAAAWALLVGCEAAATGLLRLRHRRRTTTPSTSEEQ